MVIKAIYSTMVKKRVTRISWVSRKHYIIILSLFQIIQNRWFRNSFLKKKWWGRVFFSFQKRRWHFVPQFLKNGQNVYWKEGVCSNTEVNPSYENISWCFLQSILLIIDKNNTVSCVTSIFWEHTVISRICNKFFVSYSLTYVLFKLSLSISKTLSLYPVVAKASSFELKFQVKN